MNWFRAFHLTNGSARTGPGPNGLPYWNSSYDVAAGYLATGKMPPSYALGSSGLLLTKPSPPPQYTPPLIVLPPTKISTTPPSPRDQVTPPTVPSSSPRFPYPSINSPPSLPSDPLLMTDPSAPYTPPDGPSGSPQPPFFDNSSESNLQGLIMGSTPPQVVDATSSATFTTGRVVNGLHMCLIISWTVVFSLPVLVNIF